jgi:predicted phage-related endonuclease
LWQAVANGEIPVHYRWQLEHQFMVSGAGQGHLYSIETKRLHPIWCAWER